MLASCIMPTYNRRHLIPVAIVAFLSQDWLHKELIVVDDSDQPIWDLVRHTPHLTYYHCEHRKTIGEKRNLACELAKGEVIVHWDDDDWSASGRITDQVVRLLSSNKAMTGYHDLLFWTGSRGYRYKGEHDYAVGTSMCYRRGFWEDHHFPADDRAEDNRLVFQARAKHEIVCVDGGQNMVARVHAGNEKFYPSLVGERPLQTENWLQVSAKELPHQFFEVLGA